MIANTLQGSRVFGLLDAAIFDRLARCPKIIEEELAPGDLIVIDEVQKLPSILDELHRLIERREQRFLLTGSSARKLKRGGSNLLAGRARQASLFPLTSSEIPNFDLAKYLTVGGLPGIYLSDDPWEDLKAYTGTYLREEIQSEAIVRTVRSYFEVLEDTLIGFLLPPHSKTERRKAVSRPKFYLLDLGVTNALLNQKSIARTSSDDDTRFEQFIALELRAWLSYYRSDDRLTFWRSQSGFEVDFVIGDTFAIEVKATEPGQERDLKGIRALRGRTGAATLCCRVPRSHSACGGWNQNSTMGKVSKRFMASAEPPYRPVSEELTLMPRAFLWELLWCLKWADAVESPSGSSFRCRDKRGARETPRKQSRCVTRYS